jgi:epoxyqueuosine reductase
MTDLLAMTEEEFREKFRGSPAKRAKWRGLVRNVVAALAASDDPIAEAKLERAKNHDEGLVRQQAEQSLQTIRA